MPIVYPVASSSSVYHPSSSTSSAYYHSTTPSSCVVDNPVTPVQSYSKGGYHDGDGDDNDRYYTSSTSVSDLLNSCYPTVTVTQTAPLAKATPVAGIATIVPYKPDQSIYAQYGECSPSHFAH